MCRVRFHRALSVLFVLAFGGISIPANARQAASAPVLTSPLARDARLRAPMTIAPQVLPVEAVLPLIKHSAHAPVNIHPAVLTRHECMVACANKSVASLMDALAALCLSRWLRDPKTGYELRDGDLLTNVHLPRTPGERHFHQSGMRFIQSMGTLPEALKTALAQRAIIPVQELPEPMVQAVKDHIKAQNEQSQEWSHRRLEKGFDPEYLDDCTVQMTIQPGALFTVYYIGLYWGRTEHTINGGFSFPFNDYPQRKAETDNRIASGDPSIIVTRRFEAMPQAKELPELKQVVSLKLKNATLGEVLQYLHETYGVAYVADAVLSGAANVNIGPLPLADALDRLTELYKDTEWEWRPLGFLVVRGIANPVRLPQYKPFVPDEEFTNQ